MLLFCVFTDTSIAYERVSKDVKEYCKSLKDKTFWMRIDVVRVNFFIGGKDATNVYRDGTVSYEATVQSAVSFSRQTESNDPEDFAEEIRSRQGSGVSVKVIKKGTQVKIKKVRPKSGVVEVEVESKQRKIKTKIRYQFGEEGYEMPDIKNLMDIVFAENEEEIEDAIPEINLGITLAELIKIQGRPKSKINLGTKVVLQYESLKFIFEDDKLVGIE